MIHLLKYLLKEIVAMPYFCREVKFHIISMGSRLIVQNQFSFITCQLQT